MNAQVLVTQLCLTLCDPMECSLPGSSVSKFSSKNTWVGSHFFSRGSSQLRDQTWVSCIKGRFFTIWATREALFLHESEKWKWSRSVVSDSLRPHGLWPTRLLCTWDFPGKNTKQVAVSFSRRSSRPRDWTQVSRIVGSCFTIWATREVYFYIHNSNISIRRCFWIQWKLLVCRTMCWFFLYKLISCEIIPHKLTFREINLMNIDWINHQDSGLSVLRSQSLSHDPISASLMLPIILY